MVSFDLLGPLPTTARGNEYVFLVVDLFSRHAEAYAITKGDKNTEGYAARLVNDSLHRVGDARTHFCRIAARNLCRKFAEVSSRCWVQ